jgi:hypothetical protein
MRTRDVLAVCAALLTAGLLFWPTLYRYEQVRTGDQTRPIRINRLTGQARVVFGRSDKLPDAVPISGALLKRLDVSGHLDRDGYVRGELYNGSDWEVQRIRVRIVATDPDPFAALPPNPRPSGPETLWVREYGASVFAGALSSEKWGAFVGPVPASRVTVQLMEAWGNK